MNRKKSIAVGISLSDVVFQEDEKAVDIHIFNILTSAGVPLRGPKISDGLLSGTLTTMEDSKKGTLIVKWYE